MSNDVRLRTAFRSALGLDDAAEVDTLTYREIDKWDSLAHMTLVAQIEDVATHHEIFELF